MYQTCLEAFIVTKLNNLFLDRQPHQSLKMFHCFRDLLCPIFMVLMDHFCAFTRLFVQDFIVPLVKHINDQSLT